MTRKEHTWKYAKGQTYYKSHRDDILSRAKEKNTRAIYWCEECKKRLKNHVVARTHQRVLGHKVNKSIPQFY